MISFRQRAVPDTLRALAAWDSVVRDSELTERQWFILLNTYCLQQDTNELPSLKSLMDRFGCSKAHALFEAVELSNKGMVEKHGGLLNVTQAGEYAIRGLQTKIMRIIKDSKLSRWRRPSGDDPRLKYGRKPTRRTYGHKKKSEG